MRTPKCCFRLSSFLLLLPALFLAVGCQPEAATSSNANGTSADNANSHEGMPENYAEAVAQLKECRDSVKNAFAAGTPDDCDTALHDAVHVLEHVPELAAELPEEDAATVKSTRDELFSLLEQIHDVVHPGSEKSEADISYDDLSTKIDDAIKVLESKISS